MDLAPAPILEVLTSQVRLSPPMKVSFRIIRLNKLFPLAISRGTSTGSKNLFVFVDSDGHTGVGECAPGTGFDETLADIAIPQLTDLVSHIEGLSIHEVYDLARQRNVNPTALAALDTALWDLHAKKAGMPLYDVLGLSSRSVPTSVTVGINPPDIIRERVSELLPRTGGKYLKVKLGSPDGIDADKANLLAAKEAAAQFGAGLRVDANGGWSVATAKPMLKWLADQGVEYCEQPLREGDEAGLPELFKDRPLPIFVDESCRMSSDIPKFSDCVDGVNLKLMKCGGITEALRIVATARAHGLQTMIGCMGESSVAIAAGVAIGSLFDHIDLDSHLNLNPDPAKGLELRNGVVVPSRSPGHGAELLESAIDA